LGVDLKQVPAQGKRLTRADIEAFVNEQRPVSAGLVLASPKARRLAKENGLNLTTIVGSGPEGAVLADDVLNAVAAVQVQKQAEPQTVTQLPQPAQAAPPTTGTMWRRMAERLAESWQTVPHFYLKRDVDVTELVNWRQRVLNRTGEKVTYTDLLIKLVAAALRRHPHINGQWTGTTVAFNDAVNIGLAVAVDEGLLVPVIYSADTLGVSAISERRKQIVERAQKNRLQPADLQGGTFTISNLGMFGIDEFSAIVNPPEAAILAVGRISERVIPVNGEAVIRPMMTLSLSCDHRAVDGARGAKFMDTLSQLIDDPLSLMD
jgi:pyruvate dehydrogenase E2 component (dihydrolipoamide acetyltransferase)